jgi:molybdopterin converting factor small subunit
MAEVPSVVRIRFFGPARTVFGRSVAEAAPGRVAEVLAELLLGATDSQRELVATCGRWVNGAPANEETILAPGDELALLPPVSGGCGSRP